MTVVRPYRGVSAEDRRAERRERLTEALLDVIGNEGVSAATVDKICTEAGLTKRYFYEGFADLDALMLATADALFVRLFGRMTGAANSCSPGPERIRAVVSAVLSDLAADPRGARLYVESPGHPVLRVRRDEAVDAFTAFVAENVLEAERRSPTGDLQVRIIVAGATDLITGFLAGTVPTEQDAVVSAVVALAAAL